MDVLRDAVDVVRPDVISVGSPVRQDDGPAALRQAEPPGASGDVLVLGDPVGLECVRGLTRRCSSGMTTVSAGMLTPWARVVVATMTRIVLSGDAEGVLDDAALVPVQVGDMERDAALRGTVLRSAACDARVACWQRGERLRSRRQAERGGEVSRGTAGLHLGRRE